MTVENISGNPIDEDILAAITTALHLHSGEHIHDAESYIITIRRKHRYERIQIQDQW